MRKEIVLLAIAGCIHGSGAFAANPLLAEVEIDPATRVERNAGVWLDGQYVGFVNDLRGAGKLVLVPGQHTLLFRLAGFRDVERTVQIEPGETTRFRLSLEPSPQAVYPDKAETAKLRLSVEPETAAVFVNRTFVGHIDRFNGPRGMRLAPGTYRITIGLAGYDAFETELTLRSNQTYEIKTALAKGALEDQASELVARQR